MKTSEKSPESNEVTPSKKKLKQARLPFKIISEVSPTPVAAVTRKRKLSAPETESATKIGKIANENDADLVLISDDESKGEPQTVKEEKSSNPLVKLVDAAWKKKLHKSKGGKKKKASKKNAKKQMQNGSIDNDNEGANDTTEDKQSEDCELMEVDEPQENGVNNSNSITKTETNSENETEINIDIVKESEQNVSEIVVLEDSNNSADIKLATTDKSESDIVSIETDDKDNDEIPDDDDEKNIVQTPKTRSSPRKTETASENKTESTDKDDNADINVTPKRSMRSRTKTEPNNNLKGTPSSSKLNDSVNSNSSGPTPKKSRSSSVTNKDESMSEPKTPASTTPKQLQKKIESAKKREEREKEKLERDRKKQQEKDEKAKQKQEKEEQRKREKEEKEEIKKKEKEEKEELRKKEKEEKERQKELEKKMREEKEEQKRKEKEEKEEQKRKEKEAREEEKRKKQEAVELEKQEQELKKKKAAEAFANFFVPKQKSEKDQPSLGPVSQNNILSSFTIKSDMRLAPTVRVNLSEEKVLQLDKNMEQQNLKQNELYLKCLKMGVSKPLSRGKTWPSNDKDDDDDVMIVEDELPPTDGAEEIITCETTPREKLRPKLLSFHENRRPPYWGTWRKKSSNVKPRRPFGQDEKQVDYEADSDEEWEEEQEGESIDGSAAGSDDEQDADEYEVDNEVFVPHGYLSDEEATMDEDDVLSLSPETQKARLKYLEDEFESEMKKPTEKLKPRMYGLLWETEDGGKPDNCVDAIWNYFKKLSIIMNDITPLLQPSNEPQETEKKKVKKKKIANGDGEQKSPKSEKKKKPKPEEKDGKPPKADAKKNIPEKKNQPGINMFLTKMKTS